VTPRFAAAAGHRVDRLDLPWWQLVPVVLLTVLAATGAAWQPARAASRVPITLALSLRPPRPRRVRRPAGAAAVLVVIGIVSLRLAQRNSSARDGVLEQTSAGDRDGLPALRTIATAGGAVLALAILAMTVGLIRAEAAGELRTLTATGATSGIRRTLTAATAGALALLGAILGIGAAYTVILAGSSRHQLSELARVPVVELLVIAAGVPVLAAALGWLLAGREPGSLVHVRME
jgi:hypothetical protein